jgi:ribonucleoside-diphosphate reductase alpha chain
LAENVSSGIEPVFAYTYKRKITKPDGKQSEEAVEDYAHRLYRQMHGNGPLPDYFVNAQELGPGAHIAVQAAAQRYVDSSISKTVNCPADITFDAFKDVYWDAYESGCKGCTTWRPNDVTGSILSLEESMVVKPLPARPEPAAPSEVFAPAARAKTATATVDKGVVYIARPLDRPEALPGTTYKLKWPESDHAIYITINDVVEGGRRRPFEIFINSKNMEHYAWTVALTRMISAVFRRGGDVSFVVEELKAVFDPRGGQWLNRQYVPSLLAAIGGVIEEHMLAIGFLSRPTPTLASSQPKVATLGERMAPVLTEAPSGGDAKAGGAGIGQSFKFCPRCSSPSLTRVEGCDTCHSCGYSRCS